MKTVYGIVSSVSILVYFALKIYWNSKSFSSTVKGDSDKAWEEYSNSLSIASWASLILTAVFGYLYLKL